MPILPKQLHFEPLNLSCSPLTSQGVADPTGQLPPGKVFISGYVGDKRGVRRLFGEMHNKVFLSRSPALVPSDAKLLEVVRSKPPQMTSDNWKHLCSLRFGIVVFPRPLEGMPSLPYQVGEGDLDGDLVRELSCWLLSFIFSCIILCASSMFLTAWSTIVRHQLLSIYVSFLR